MSLAWVHTIAAAPAAAIEGPVDCTVTAPDGAELVLPAYAGADGRWAARLRPSQPGEHRYLFASSAGVLDEGALTVDAPAAGSLRAAPAGRHLVAGDGSPFLWIADTWWYGLVDRISTDEFRAFAERRRDEGYSVIQIVAGLYPEIGPYDRLGSTNGRFPWHEGWAGLDPAWWDDADERIGILVEAGLVPCLVGAWSYYLLEAGDEVLRRHWRELVARWAAYPVVWCVAGEAGLPHYDDALGPDAPRLVTDLVARWDAIGRDLRRLDPYDNPVTLHPCPAFHHQATTDIVADPELVDLVLMQTGHAAVQSLAPSLDALDRERWRQPVRPVINSEVSYDSATGASGPAWQRLLVWSHLLSGAAGHTYGAHGLWSMRDPADPGPGDLWGPGGWREASELPAGREVGLAGRLLRELPWEALEPRQEWVDPHSDPGRRTLPYCAGAPGRCRVVYIPAASFEHPGIGISLHLRDVRHHALEPGPWRARIVDPRTGATRETLDATPDATGTWRMPERSFVTALPTLEDWLVILERGD